MNFVDPYTVEFKALGKDWLVDMDKHHNVETISFLQENRFYKLLDQDLWNLEVEEMSLKDYLEDKARDVPFDHDRGVQTL